MKDCVGKATLKVSREHLADAMKTGSVKVLSSAILLALMEEAACKAINPKELGPGQCTVGCRMDMIHRRPTALGAEVTAIARVKEIHKKQIQFEIEAFDETGLVGTASHIRALVDKQKFEDRCYETARKAQSKKE